MTTLRDNTQKEGARVLDFLEQHSQRVLADHGFENDGRALEAVVEDITAGPDRRGQAERVDKQLTVVLEEMADRGFSPEQIESVRRRAVDGIYEDPAHCTNGSVDDVSVKKQKAHRERLAAASRPANGSTAIEPPAVGSPGASEAGKSSRPKVANTVARIEQGS